MEKGIHLPGMNTETCLIPNDSDEEKLLVAEKYNFVTECFYFAHRAINLGYQVTVDKLVRLNHVSKFDLWTFCLLVFFKLKRQRNKLKTFF